MPRQAVWCKTTGLVEGSPAQAWGLDLDGSLRCHCVLVSAWLSGLAALSPAYTELQCLTLQATLWGQSFPKPSGGWIRRSSVTTSRCLIRPLKEKPQWGLHPDQGWSAELKLSLRSLQPQAAAPCSPGIAGSICIRCLLQDLPCTLTVSSTAEISAVSHTWVNTWKNWSQPFQCCSFLVHEQIVWGSLPITDLLKRNIYLFTCWAEACSRQRGVQGLFPCALPPT